MQPNIITEKSNMIDYLHQMSINLETNPSINEVNNFIKETQKYLDTNLENNLAIELFSTITSCFSHYPNDLLNIFNDLFQKAKTNANYLIINVSVIYELLQHKINMNDYNPFILDLLKEILPQIKTNSSDNLKIYNFEIPAQFQNDLILNLIISSNLTDDLIYDVFPFIIEHNLKSLNPKIEKFLEKISNSCYNKIFQQNDISNQEILEFAKSKNNKLLYGFNKSSLSVIINAFIYAKSSGKIKIKGLSKENIIQFISILTMFLEYQQNQKYFPNSDLTDLLKNGIKSFKNSNSHTLISLIELVLAKYSILLHNQIISYNDLLQILLTATHQSPLEICMPIIITSFQIICELSDQIQFTSQNFFNDFYNQNKDLIESLFNNVMSNLVYINNCKELKCQKFNVEIIDHQILINHIENSKSFIEVENILYFIDNLCCNHSKLTESNEFAFSIIRITKEKSTIDKNNNFDLIKNYINKFRNKKSGQNDGLKEKTIDEIIEYILSDSNLEKNDNLFEALFDKMMKYKSMQENYIGILLNKDTELSYDADIFLKMHLQEFEKYEDTFIEMTNKKYYYNAADKLLISNPNYRTSTIAIENMAYEIVDKLFKSIDENPNNFQAFLCLKSIASSFPNIFLKKCQQVFDYTLHAFENFYLIYEKDLNDDHTLSAKTAYSAFSFLLATFQSTIILDEFFKWLFSNIINFSNSQVLAFILITNLCFNDGKIFYILNVYYEKFAFLETLGNLLDQNMDECSFKNIYLESIYLLTKQIYISYTKYDQYIITQVEKFMDLEYPLNYIFEVTFSNIPTIFINQKIPANRINIEISKFIDDINRIRKFWINYSVDKNQNHPNTEQNNIFCSKLIKHEPYIIPSFVTKFEGQFSIRMTEYIVLQPYLIYGWFLYPKYKSFVEETGNMIVNTYLHLNDLHLISSQSNEEKDDNIKSLDVNEYFLPKYCQDILLRNLFNISNLALMDNKCFASLAIVIDLLSQNDICFFTILQFISECLNDLFINDPRNENIQSKKIIYRLIDLLALISKNKNFNQNFFDICENNLFNVVLSPYYRNDSSLFMKIANLFLNINFKLANNINHFIGFMFLIDNVESVQHLIKFCSKFNKEQIMSFQKLSSSKFDKLIQKQVNIKTIIDLIRYFPDLAQEKYSCLLSLSDDLLDKYFNANQNDKPSLACIYFLLNKLAPKRDEQLKISNINLSESNIPSEIIETSPPFWKLFEKYSKNIIDIIQKDHLLLGKFKFLLDFHELIDFSIRSSYFKKQMKSKIKYNTLIMKIDFNNILPSSYTILHNKSPYQLLSDFKIEVPSSIVSDSGGVKREWFTKLAKEIFNQNYALLECVEKTNCYQPSSSSYINPNHLEYFRFFGQFVARSLIEGVCIDAHLTTSFYKQILHYKPDLNDLKHLDENLYQSSEWILQNDIDSLDLYFEIDTNEFGENKTIPLKENGSEIRVTNENKEEFIQLRTNYILVQKIEKQIKAFCEGFESLINHNEIKIFTPKELDLLICGTDNFDVKDFIEHIEYDFPYNSETPVVKMFFNAIQKWNNQDLQKLLMFMTGSSRIPINGFKEFCEMSRKSLRIGSGGIKSNLPQAHTCANTLNLPDYDTEEELNEKLFKAINECNTFENV